MGKFQVMVEGVVLPEEASSVKGVSANAVWHAGHSNRVTLHKCALY